MQPSRILPAFMANLVLLPLFMGCGQHGTMSTGRASATAVRPFRPVIDDRWIGNAICYGPHRDGQRPGGAAPTREQMREDLLLMLPHWNMLRLYGSSEVAETVLDVIRADSLDMKVMLGVWIATEEDRDASGAVVAQYPVAAAANRREADAAIDLAAKYPEIVVAVCVGNETQVSWSPFPSPLDILIDHVRRVRAAVSVPVTAADDFLYWLEPESRALAREVDFITTHAHPMWNGQQLAEALPWLQRQLAAVKVVHPDRSIVIGETGWATSVHDQGEQAVLIKGAPGEAEQARFYEAARGWAASERVTMFIFEAFDENWKGGDHPAEVEKHWGVFRADRTGKAAVSKLPRH